MDTVTLKKKLSACISDGGYLKNVSDDALYEVLIAWENWTGNSKDFYRSLGFSQRQMASLIGKAKKLKRNGHFGDSEFKVLKIEGAGTASEQSQVKPCSAAELVWANGQLIRFSDISNLIDFLKKSA